jgi:hypothetical protein
MVPPAEADQLGEAAQPVEAFQQPTETVYLMKRSLPLLEKQQ